MKAKKRKAVVKGPQLPLKLPKAKGEPHRTARMRFMEKPAKVVGNPFFAVRVPRNLLAAFRKWCGKRHPNDVVRAYMSKVTGVKVVEAGADD
jgi:hypothetical protein